MARKRGAARVLTEHVGHVPYESATLERVEAAAIGTIGKRTARAAEAIVVLNSKVAAEMERLAPEARLLTIPNGVDVSAYRPPQPGEREAIRAELGWDERPRALFVGRLVAKKGVELAVEAAREADGAFALAMVGRGRSPDGGSHVEALGELPRDRVAQLYRAADALVLPSRGEGFPLTVQEAMASGLPVVLLDDPAYEPYLRGAGEGARTVPATAEAIAGAVTGMVADPGRRQAAGAAARAHAEESFSWPSAVDRHEELYRELVERRGRLAMANPPTESRLRNRLVRLESTSRAR